jgi:uncharacterized protein (DUF849 family)
MSEADAPAVMALLTRCGIGIEAGLASTADAERFLRLPNHDRVFRILIEIGEQELGKAQGVADGIAAVLDGAGLRRPMLLHGVDATVWPFVAIACQRSGRRGSDWRTANICPTAPSRPATPSWW